MEIKKRKVEVNEESSVELYPLSTETMEILKKRGINRLFPIQAKSFNYIFNKNDILGKAKTGTGKTLAFVLPVIERLIKKGKFHTNEIGRKPLVLVLLPTRELAQQVSNEFELMKGNNRYKVVSIYGGSPEYPQIQEVKKGVDIIVGCPGRVLDFIERNILNVSKINVLILDEADKMLEMGFKEYVDKVIDFVKKQTSEENTDKNRRFQILLFSATVPSWIKKIVNEIMSNDTVTVDVTNISVDGNEDSNDRGNTRIRHLAIQCAYPQRTALLKDIITMYAGIHGKCIIFTETKQTANEISMRSTISDMCQVLHGDIQQSQREIALQAFKEGRYRCLVATDVAARGLHIDDIAVVIQLAPPRDIDTYIHRAGRTGRAGKFGTAILFCNMSDYPFLLNIEKIGNINFQRIGAPQFEEILQKTANSIGEYLVGKNISSTILNSVVKPAKDIIIKLWKKLQHNTQKKRQRKQIEDRDNDLSLNNMENVPDIPECAIDALAYCLIELTGINSEISEIPHRSVLNGREEFKSYLIKFSKLKDTIASNGYIWRCLKNNLRGYESLIEKIQCMTLLKSGDGAVFDIPVVHLKEWEDAIQKLMCKTKDVDTSTFQISAASSNLPELVIPNTSNSHQDFGSNLRVNQQHISNKIGFRQTNNRTRPFGRGGVTRRGRY
ncbi:DEAD DEAH box helicase family protein [Cryptosporidium andersoni]|uniref:DEAD DEAH box helicase family protein n=1 Tax=Cryptosporidium andersoni TaxID=117008 RepID=A0A1J4MDD7_9CRYT|nr:DEAD DEAH box helicase family protein [Cryptosporidium andersoni]